MNILTTSSISILLFALGFMMGGKKFSETLKIITTSNSVHTAKILSLYFLIVGIQNAVIGIGGELFHSNSQAMRFILITSNFFLILHSSLGAYIAYDIFYPHSKKIYLLLTILSMGFLSILIINFSSIEPRINKGQLDMNLPISVAWLIFTLIFVSWFSVASIFLKIFKFSKVLSTKYFSLAILFLLNLAIISAFLRVVIYGSEATPIFVNLMFSMVGILFVLIFLFPFKLFKTIKS